MLTELDELERMLQSEKAIGNMLLLQLTQLPHLHKQWSSMVKALRHLYPGFNPSLTAMKVSWLFVSIHWLPKAHIPATCHLWHESLINPMFIIICSSVTTRWKSDKWIALHNRETFVCRCFFIMYYYLHWKKYIQYLSNQKRNSDLQALCETAFKILILTIYNSNYI